MLEIKNLRAHYGNIEALHGINLQVGDGELVAIVGSNGAGKTTLLNAISGHVAKQGIVSYNNKELTKLSPKQIVNEGILQVPEGRCVFPGLTVQQNLAVGSVAWAGFFRKNIESDLERVFMLFPRLKERSSQLAWSLSGGEQQMLAVGRALMGRPKLLMLDEPSMGLAPKVIDEMFQKIIEINKAGTPILLVEQNALLALEVSDRAYVIEQGAISFHGKSSELIHNSRVREAYLGKSRRSHQ